MMEKLQEVEKQNKSLEKLNPEFAKESLLTLEISISELNWMDFIKLCNQIREELRQAHD